MLWKNLLSGCAIALSMLGNPTRAAVSVSGQTSGGAASSTNGYRVDVTAAAGNTVTVTVTDNSTIEWVRVTCSGSSSNHVTLTFVGALGPIAEITRETGSTSELWLSDLAAPALGSVTVNEADHLTATASTDGHISGTITILGTNHDASAKVAEIKSNHGLITANISSVLPVELIEATNGTIGTSTTLVTISTTGALGEVFAKEIHAAITVNSGNGDIQYLHTATPGGSYTGVFRGSLACGEITGASVGTGYGLDVRGNLDADIDHDEAMATRFRIGGSLTSTSDILLPAGGLTNQIIINANDDGGEWLGAIKINGTAISHDSAGVYTNTASSLGGGSVGLVPFRLHKQSSDPVDGAVFYDSFFDPNWIGEGDPPCEHAFDIVMLRLYGPVAEVTPAPGDLPICKIERAAAGCQDPPCGGWYEVDYEDYVQEIVNASDSVGRLVKITCDDEDGLWDTGFMYRFTLQEYPATSGNTTLDCAQINAAAVRAPVFTLTFTLLDGCASDMDMLYDQNGDDSLTAEDLEAWPGANPDVSADNNVTAFDLYKLMCGWVQRDNLPR